MGRRKAGVQIQVTPMQLLFCHEYLVDLNATKAARRAGYSTKTARIIAVKLMQKPLIKAIIQNGMNKRAKKIGVDADKVLRELSRIGFSDLRDMFEENGQIKEVSKWPHHIARCIASIEVEETFEGHGENRVWTGYTKKVKFWDKVRALELLGKHKVLFSDRTIHTVVKTLEDVIAGSWEKEQAQAATVQIPDIEIPDELTQDEGTEEEMRTSYDR
jgi:phage terminase small subunit